MFKKSEQIDGKATQVVLERDLYSYAEPNKVSINHVDLELIPDFEKHQISGVAELSLDWHDKDANTLVLDTQKLNIQLVEALDQQGQWHPVPFSLGEEDKILGSALIISLGIAQSKVRVIYQTSPDATGLQWLDPKQTATKIHPYLFSNSEPFARSWVPLQDTPQVRLTYNAHIKTPPALRAVMSAENDPDHPLNGSFIFKMVQKIPSYLIAFAIGNISAKKIGPRSSVYAEPNIVDSAAQEFEDTEQMIQTTERLFGPYRWDIYDVLVLPPSFPMGGMENPRMTFLTPTIIAGDKSLVSVVAHEAAHSWSGNLVTSGLWGHIWLNEGFTSYIENRIVEEIYGKEQAAQQLIVKINNLYEEMKELSEEYQKLVVNLQGEDPEGAFTRVAYIKGAWFLNTLEKRFGRELFDKFLQEYFNTFAFQSVTTDIFEDFLQKHLIDKYPDRCSIEYVKSWIYNAGIPADAIRPHSLNFITIEGLLQQWVEEKIPTTELQANHWSSNEWQYFLNKLPINLPLSQLKALDSAYHLTGTGNQVVASEWYKVAIASGYDDINPAIHKYLVSIGRRLLVAPLYDELLKTEEGKHFAQLVYAEARPTYHAVTRATIDKKFAKVSLPIPVELPPRIEADQAATIGSRFSYFTKSKVVEEPTPEQPLSVSP